MCSLRRVSDPYLNSATLLTLSKFNVLENCLKLNKNSPSWKKKYKENKNHALLWSLTNQQAKELTKPQVAKLKDCVPLKLCASLLY